jgi:hypothetical protein
MAFPQCLELTVSVRVAMPDGRYRPADSPIRISPDRIPNRVELRETASSDPPRVTDERTIVHLWVRRDETNPEPKSPEKKPREIQKKREPASVCPIFKSLSIVGIRGDRIILERKLREKIAVKYRRNGT